MGSRYAGLLAALALLAGCSGGGAGTPSPASSAPGPIVVASGLDVTGSDGVRQQLIAQWNGTPEGKRHPARLVELPGGADEQRSQLLGALQSGSAQYDVVNLDVTWVPEFAQAGLIDRLDGQVDLGTDFVPSVAGTGMWRRHTYAVPFNSDVGLLYYRPDYLRAVGIDPANYPSGTTTWPGLQSLVRELDAAPHSDVLAAYQKGWTSQLAEYEGLTVNTVEAFATAGVRLTDDDGRYTTDPDHLRIALEALRDRADSQYTLHGALSSYEAQSLADFAAGRTAFLRHWPYAYRLLAQSMQGQWAVAPLPGRAVLGGQDLAVSSASPRARYATELVRFLTGKASERCLLDAGFAATRVSAYQDGSVHGGLPQHATPSPGTAPGQSASPAPGASPSGGETKDMPRDADGRPAYAATTLLTALTAAVQRPRTPYYGAFTHVLQSTVHDWLADPDPPDSAQVAHALDTALRKALKGR